MSETSKTDPNATEVAHDRWVGLGWTWGQLNNAERRAAEIRQNAVYDIRRNLPVFPSTFGPCGNACGRGSGRGCGPCLACAQDALASVTSSEIAARFVAAAREMRNAEAEVYETPAPEANTQISAPAAGCGTSPG